MRTPGRTAPALPGTLRFLGALLAVNLKASLALRGVFWAQAVFMLLNNLTFFVFWVIFFERVDSVAGWRIADVALIFGIAAAGFGLMVIFTGGIDTLARSISSGELDSVLVQPRNALLHEIASKSRASGWGDLATGLLFLAFGGGLTAANLPFVLLAVAASALVFISLGIVLHSLAFWMGDVEALARQVQDFTLTFALYPSPLFSGVVRIVLFTLIPAGFVSHLPAENVRSPDVLTTAAVLASAVLLPLAAYAFFSLGLRRYQSGSGFGMRG